MKRTTRNIVKVATAAGGIASLALLLAKGPEDPEYINPRFETASVTHKSYTPPSEEWVFFDPLLLPLTFPASYNVTLRAGECEQTFDDKQLYETKELNSTVPVTVWELRKLLPGRGFALLVDGGCAIEHYTTSEKQRGEL